MSHVNHPGLTLPGYARRHKWRLFILVMFLSVTVLAQCVAAEVPASPSSEPAKLCACNCAPLSTLPPAPLALPTLAFYLPHRLPPLRWVDESENIALPLVARRVWFTRGPPYPSLSLS